MSAALSTERWLARLGGLLLALAVGLLVLLQRLDGRMSWSAIVSGGALGAGGVLLVWAVAARRAAARLDRLLDATDALAERSPDAHALLEGAGEGAAVRAEVGADGLGMLAERIDALVTGLRVELLGLTAERDLLNGILSGMEEGVLLVDSEGRVARINPALKSMLPFLAEPIGRPLLEAVRHEELKILLDEVHRSGQAVARELELPGLNPRRLLVQASPGSRLPLQPGVLGLLAVFIDVTQLRRLETLRREFVANVSHELRTPVTAIRSASETLRSGAADDPEAAPVFLEIIERNSGRLHALIEDLLELSRIESREVRLERVPLEVARLLGHMVGLQGEAARRRGLELVLDVPAEPVYVLADERAVEQILTNLIDNALKYCPSGRVVVRARQEGSRVVFGVLDMGPGIAARHLPRLFERFFRVDPGRSRAQGGTGLGLAIVKHLTEAMGGRVWVTSEVGRGSEFGLELPGCEEEGLE